MSQLTQFHDLVVNILGTDNDVRTAAEKAYNELPINTKGTLLLQLYMDANVNAEVRSMSLVLFRRLLSSDYNEFWTAVGPEAKPQFLDQFVQFTTQEETPVLRKRLTDIVAEVARNTINDENGKQEWPGVMQLIEHCATSEKPSLREVGMQLIENVPNIFGCDQDRYMDGIKQMFHSSLLYGADAQVRTAAVRAYVAFVCDNEENDHVVRSLSDLIPAVIQVCQHVVENEDDDDVPLQCLSDLASAVPKTLAPHLDTISELCLSTVSNVEKDESYRHSALEVLVSFCESAPGTMRKRGSRYLPLLVQLCLRMMTELEEDVTEWLACDNIDEDEDEENVSIGETSLDRICCAVGGKTVMQPLLQAINEILKSADWKHRHAGIMGLSTMGEGCKRQMEPLIAQIINDMVLPYIADPHPRVRYAVCNCLGQMCTDFAPTAQKKCHEKIVAALINTAADLNTPRVAAHAGAAIVNFCEECPKNIISVYLKAIMEKLEYILEQTFRGMLESGKKLVLEQVITSIAAVADAAENNFVEFYDRLAPPLKYILANASSPDLKGLRGKTMECLSLIGIAVGRDKFRADANEIMATLLQSGLKFDDEDDAELSYMISSWARLCKVLGPEFAPYLEHVMPSVLKTAQIQPNVSIMDDDKAEECDDEDWNIIPLGDQRSLGVKTAGLEDKLTACEMLVSFARELGTGFAPYVQPVLALMLTELKYIFHDGVRSAAAECLPPLVGCVREQGIAAERQIFEQVLPALIASLDNESDLEVLADKLFAIAQLAEDSGSRLFTEEDLKTVFIMLQAQMKRYEDRLAEIRKSRKDEEFDEEDQLELEEVYDLESGVLARISDIVHYLFVGFEERLVPYFGTMNNQFSVLLDANRPWRDRQWGICIYDDVIEFGGAARRNYQGVYLEPMLRYMADQYPEVRQAAAYGMGVLAMKGGVDFAHACAQALTPLAAAIQLENVRDTEEGVAATENAISAVAKILKYNSSALDPNTVIPTFVQWLPVWEDAEEIPYIYDYFCDLVEQNHPLVLGENNQGLVRVFEIILHTFSRGAFSASATEEPKQDLLAVKTRLVNIMKMLQQNEAIFQQILQVSQLNSRQQEILQEILAS